MNSNYHNYLVLLGTGTSHGVPVLGCTCPTCTSTDPHDQRYRSSAYLVYQAQHILIDTATEFRLQALREKIPQIDAVLITHAHADHIGGFDDLRRFNQLQEASIPVYGNLESLSSLKNSFSYIFDDQVQVGGGKPQVELVRVDKEFVLNGIKIQPIPVYHGKLLIYGYRIGKTAYLTDCSSLPETSIPLLEGLELLVLGVLRYRPHPTHLHQEAALELIARLKPAVTILTHVCHDFKHDLLSQVLPANVILGYDGQCIEVR